MAYIIDLYCAELEQFLDYIPSRKGQPQPRPALSRAQHSAIGNPPSQPTGPIPHGNSPRQTAVIATRPALPIAEASIRRFPWSIGPIYRPVIQFPTASTNGLYNPAEVRFFHAPESVPGIFPPVPDQHATVTERDDYVRRFADRNADFAMCEWVVLVRSPSEIGNTEEAPLRILKKFGDVMLDPSTNAIRAFSRPRLPKLWLPLPGGLGLKFCGF